MQTESRNRVVPEVIEKPRKDEAGLWWAWCGHLFGTGWNEQAALARLREKLRAQQ